MRSAPTLKIWITPFASVAMLEKFALLKIALWSAPVLSRASRRRTSVRPGAVAAPLSGMAGSRYGMDTVPSLPGPAASAWCVQEGTAGSPGTTGGCRENPRHPPAQSSAGSGRTAPLASAAAQADDVGQRHPGFRHGPPDQASTGQRGAGTRKNASLEVGIRERRGRLGPPG